MIRVLAASSLAFLVLLTSASAVVEKIEMESVLWEEARGEALIEDLGPGTMEITVNVENMAPGSAYTVWFVNEEPRVEVEGVGDSGANSFWTDSEGKGVFKARVEGHVVEAWQKLEVAYHPEGDPREPANLRIALVGELREGPRREGMGP